MDSIIQQKESSRKRYLTTDYAFDELYSPAMQALSADHWTPLPIARLATDFLTSGPPSKILHIGSGVGKFCLAGACYAPRHHFYGIEQRAYVVEEAKIAQRKMGLNNVSFLLGNLTQLDLSQFNHFYFFNSFYENLNDERQIDHDIEYSKSLYSHYVSYLHKQLRVMPVGTRVATYHSRYEEIPLSYDLIDTLEEGQLNFWIKRR
jgi:hypothetical protein